MSRFFKCVFCLLVLMGGCSEQSSRVDTASTAPAKAVRIGAVNAPLAYFAARLGGEGVEILALTQAGMDPSDWEPTPQDVLQMQRMDLILINGAGYERWLNQVSLPSEKLIDTSADIREQFIEVAGVTHQHGPDGEHSHAATASTLWLNPVLAKAQARFVHQAIAANFSIAPDPSRLEALLADLDQLDKDWQIALAPLQTETVLFSHPVYQYFKARYALRGDAFHWEPDTYPVEEEWTKLAQKLETDPVRLMFWEESPLAITIERLKGLGIEVVVVNPGAQSEHGSDYLSLQQRNLESVQSALARRGG